LMRLITSTSWMHASFPCELVGILLAQRMTSEQMYVWTC
jgi:hypothetical protein